MRANACWCVLVLKNTHWRVLLELEVARIHECMVHFGLLLENLERVLADCLEGQSGPLCEASKASIESM